MQIFSIIASFHISHNDISNVFKESFCFSYKFAWKAVLRNVAKPISYPRNYLAFF